MHRWMLCAILLGLGGNESHHQLTQPISVVQAQTKIKPGMNTAEVVRLMGKPWRDEGGSTTEPGLHGATTRYKRLFWHQGNTVARIDFTNDRVTAVQLRHFPDWAIRDFGNYGTNMSEAKHLLGPPSRSAKRMRSGQYETWWVYTDKTGSEKTLLLIFDAKGRSYSKMLGPNRSDYDDLPSK